MAKLVSIETGHTLEDYEGVAHLAPAVHELKAEVQHAAQQLQGRTIWMVNSTAQGGGVAEMMPTMVALLRDLGVDIEWAVIESDREEFFDLTKRIHNMIHGAGSPEFKNGDREVYEAVNRENADFFRERLKEDDVLVVHDPQPMALAGILRESMNVRTVWRCHIGLDERTPQTVAAWDFLRPYGEAYERSVFSAPEYIPDYFAKRSSLIYPAVNPLTAKNRDLNLHQLVEILANASLATLHSPQVALPFEYRAMRLQRDGSFRDASLGEEIGLLTRPIVTQVSRWDRLKGFLPLMEAFTRLKNNLRQPASSMNAAHRRRLKLARLVLVGPDPASVADDPEGLEVLRDLSRAYQELDPLIQDDVALVTLPMESREENALMVNALQRASTVVVQNSLREGFGLTVTEAMWKRLPVLSNTRACGPRHQIRDGIDGRTVDDPEDTKALAAVLNEMLADEPSRRAYGRSAQRHVHQNFLIFSQLQSWVRLLNDLLSHQSDRHTAAT